MEDELGAVSSGSGSLSSEDDGEPAAEVDEDDSRPEDGDSGGSSSKGTGPGSLGHPRAGVVFLGGG